MVYSLKVFSDRGISWNKKQGSVPERSGMFPCFVYMGRRIRKKEENRRKKEKQSSRNVYICQQIKKGEEWK